MEKLKGMEVSVSRSAQVGLQFPVGCIHRALRRDSGSFLEHQCTSQRSWNILRSRY
ncbi:hypothetical protein SCLCIDRAFT_1206796 [Scleroderma citrinum Foug A]|uniref:Uncharacterized protein n=1 Tax=Scleroderma citrinum Foug A TaxID=1036808 RepID=A0A0C3AA94_9AGAM|nr:hypothetical protein SCLCIDRAFT_1206796 [Scleroderma citrinum Foug A]